jgi:hypothetical protein
MGPLTPDSVPLSSTPILEPSPTTASVGPEDDEPDGDATVPNLKNVETHKVDKLAAADAIETVKHPKLDPATVAHGETGKVVKADGASDQPATESERTPETPPPEMAAEGDAGWFAQSAQAALADEEDALSLKKKTPRWVIPAALSAAAVVGLLLWAQSGPSKGTSPAGTVATVEQPVATEPKLGTVNPTTPENPAPTKVEVATVPTTLPTESKPATAEPLAPTAKPETPPVAAVKPEEPAKPTPKAEPLEVKAEPKAEPIATKPETKPVVAKVEPKPEPIAAKPEAVKPVVAKAEPKPAKPEPKPIAQKPEAKPVPMGCCPGGC